MEIPKGRPFAGRWLACLIVLLSSGIMHAGTHHHYYTDPQGTVLAKTDAQGNVIATYDYAPYGHAVASMSGAPGGPGYTGHVNDPETGLVYMQARYYDPEVGRFLSVDPVGPSPGNVSSFSRYPYANNNPISNIDPDGRIVRSTNPKNNAYIAGLINSKAKGSFKFDKDNNLQLVSSKGDGSKFSAYYKTKLLQAISSKSYVTMDVAKTVQTKTYGEIDVNGKKSGGGVTIGGKNGGTQAITISGDANNSIKDASGTIIRDDPGDILAHEVVGHAAPHIVGADTGNAVEDENKVRAEIPGSGKRAEEPSHVE